MNVSVPPAIAQRPIFYRETSSFYFDPIAFSVANFLVELPWLAGIILATLPIVYFMVRIIGRER